MLECKNHRNRRNPISIARTVYQCGKLQNIKLEMERLKLDILGVCEVRWKGKGDFCSDKYRVIYSGGELHERRVAIILDKKKGDCVHGYWQLSDRVIIVKLNESTRNISIIMVYAPTGESTEEELEELYECLENAKAQCKAQELLIIMGDLNAKVGKEKEGQSYNVIGKHSLGKRNERGERFIQ